jgi:hypothetical protein
MRLLVVGCCCCCCRCRWWLLVLFWQCNTHVESAPPGAGTCLLWFAIHQTTTFILSKHDESPLYMSCWIIEPLPVDQQSSKMTCRGRDLIWQYGKPWQVFLMDHMLFLIVVNCLFFGLSSMEGSYGYALDVMESCYFEGRVFLQWWERNFPLQQSPGAPGLFLPPTAKLSRDEHWFPCDEYISMIQSK